MERIGTVTHYYRRINVAVLTLNAELKVGDTAHFHGHTTDFTQTITSMEIDFEKVSSAGPRQAVAVQVTERVRAGDTVYRAPEDEEDE
jgi:putative protease